MGAGREALKLLDVFVTWLYPRALRSSKDEEAAWESRKREEMQSHENSACSLFSQEENERLCAEDERPHIAL